MIRVENSIQLKWVRESHVLTYNGRCEVIEDFESVLLC